MLRKDIDKIFTDTIKIYLEDNFYIFSNTMGGYQGEIAKVDLFDGKNFRRVYMNHGTEYTNVNEYRHMDLDYISIIVGISTDKVSDNGHEIVWNEHLNVLSERRYYRIGESWCSNYFGNKEEAIAARLKRYERIRKHANKYIYPDDSTIVFSDEAKKIVLPYMKKQRKCSSITVKQIDKVYKEIRKNRNGKEEVGYYIQAKGQLYKMRNYKITNKVF